MSHAGPCSGKHRVICKGGGANVSSWQVEETPVLESFLVFSRILASLLLASFFLEVTIGNVKILPNNLKTLKNSHRNTQERFSLHRVGPDIL